jgi:hypothetical protein
VHSVKCREDVLFNKQGRDCMDGENERAASAGAVAMDDFTVESLFPDGTMHAVRTRWRRGTY